MGIDIVSAEGRDIQPQFRDAAGIRLRLGISACTLHFHKCSNLYFFEDGRAFIPNPAIHAPTLAGKKERVKRGGLEERVAVWGGYAAQPRGGKGGMEGGSECSMKNQEWKDPKKGGEM